MFDLYYNTCLTLITIYLHVSKAYDHPLYVLILLYHMCLIFSWIVISRHRGLFFLHRIPMMPKCCMLCLPIWWIVNSQLFMSWWLTVYWPLQRIFDISFIIACICLISFENCRALKALSPLSRKVWAGCLVFACITLVKIRMMAQNLKLRTKNYFCTSTSLSLWYLSHKSS